MINESDKIILADPNKCNIGGHNYLYRKYLSKIDHTEIFDYSIELPQIKKKPIKAIINRIKYAYSIPSGGFVCLLQLDSIYQIPFIFSHIKKEHKGMIGVLHWFPTDVKRQKLLKMTASYFSKIVVHSDYIKQKCIGIGILNVATIDYPCFCEIDTSKLVRIKANEEKVFTCLGGSRNDKGLDILRKSFKYIMNKENLKFVIAGKEVDFSYSQIVDEAKKYNISIKVINKVLSEEEYWNYIVNSDVILLPYKRIFTGNSGPMTDGVYFNKYILGPDEGNLNYLIKKYHLGSTFEIENPRSLANEIDRVCTVSTNISSTYRDKLETSHFIELYTKLFEDTF